MVPFAIQRLDAGRNLSNAVESDEVRGSVFRASCATARPELLDAGAKCRGAANVLGDGKVYGETRNVGARHGGTTQGSSRTRRTDEGRYDVLTRS